MDQNRILLKIERMIGNEFMIEGFNETVKSYSFNKNSVTVGTDKRKRTFSEEQFME